MVCGLLPGICVGDGSAYGEGKMWWVMMGAFAVRKEIPRLCGVSDLRPHTDGDVARAITLEHQTRSRPLRSRSKRILDCWLNAHVTLHYKSEVDGLLEGAVFQRCALSGFRVQHAFQIQAPAPATL